MLQTRKRLSQLRLWSNLWKMYVDDIPSEIIESKFHKNCGRIWFSFTIEMLLCVAVFPFVGKELVLWSEICVLSAVLAFMAHLILTDKFNNLIITSVIINLLIRTPILQYVREYLSLSDSFPEGLRIFSHTVFPNALGNLIFMNVPLLLYMTVPCLLLLLAAKQSWQGVWTLMIPHFISLCWWTLAQQFYRHSTQGGILVTSMACAILFCFTHLFAGAMILLPGLAIAQHVMDLYGNWGLFIIALVTLMPMLLCWICRRKNYSLKRITTPMQVFLGVAALISILPTFSSYFSISPRAGQTLPLSWEQYMNYCHKPAWSDFSQALVQIDCTRLQGEAVQWEGTIKEVKISQIRNDVRWGLNFMPKNLVSLLECLLGNPFPDCSLRHSSHQRLELCNFIKKHSSAVCTLEKWDRYEFEVSVGMNTGFWALRSLEIRLLAGNEFTEVVLGMRSGDEVKFTAILKSELGAANLELQLLEISCIKCTHGPVNKTIKQSPSALDVVNTALSSAFDFFLTPIRD